MPRGFHKLSVCKTNDGGVRYRGDAAGPPSHSAAAPAAPAGAEFESDEEAARFYLDGLVKNEQRPSR